MLFHSNKLGSFLFVLEWFVWPDSVDEGIGELRLVMVSRVSLISPFEKGRKRR